MANIDMGTLQVIVENAMRTNKMGGQVTANGVTMDFEKVWKTQIEVNGQIIEIPVNYQSLRDAIAKSILDSLTALSATGAISTGPIDAPNAQVVVTSSDVNINPTAIPFTPKPNVNINTIDPTKSAARLGDDITITDPVFLAWIAAVGAYTNIPGPVIISGKITSGSDTVRIGD